MSDEKPKPAAMTEAISAGLLELRAKEEFAYRIGERGRSIAYFDACRILETATSSLTSELSRMKAIVEKLPKTADGVPIVPGMTVFCRYPESVRPYDGAYEFEVVVGGREVRSPNDVAELGSGPWFLTREAALAATPHAGEKEKT